MTKKTLPTAALIALLAPVLTATSMTPVLATKSREQPADKSMQHKQAAQDYVNVSQDARLTMTNVGNARLAIFNGLPYKAQVYADAAVTRVARTLKEADKYAMDIKAPKKDGDKYIPFDASLSVAESLVPNEENLKHIAKANKHLKNGESNKAVEALKVGGINVALKTELVPIQMAKHQIESASKLIGEGKYYEANLALKSVEDSVITEVLDADTLSKKAGALPKKEDHS